MQHLPQYCRTKQFFKHQPHFRRSDAHKVSEKNINNFNCKNEVKKSQTCTGFSKSKHRLKYGRVFHQWHWLVEHLSKYAFMQRFDQLTAPIIDCAAFIYPFDAYMCNNNIKSISISIYMNDIEWMEPQMGKEEKRNKSIFQFATKLRWLCKRWSITNQPNCIFYMQVKYLTIATCNSRIRGAWIDRL